MVDSGSHEHVGFACGAGNHRPRCDGRPTGYIHGRQRTVRPAILKALAICNGCMIFFYTCNFMGTVMLFNLTRLAMVCPRYTLLKCVAANPKDVPDMCVTWALLRLDCAMPTTGVDFSQPSVDNYFRQRESSL